MMSHKKVQQGIYVHTHRACHMMLKGFSTAFFFSSTPMFPAFHATIDADGHMWLQKRIKTMQEYDTTQTEQLILIGCRVHTKAEQFYLSKEPILHHISKDSQLAKIHTRWHTWNEQAL